MRFLIVGAGAIGGYFGGRLIEKGEDVTFLVRENRRKQLAENGLVIKSVHGDYQTNDVQTISATENAESFDVILLSTKAYHLDQAIKDITPFVGDNTVIIPLLNGYKQYDVLREAFTSEKILGGLCFIETTLNAEGEIVHTSPKHGLVFGEWDGSISEKVTQIENHFDGVNFQAVLSKKVQTDIWHKYIFIAAMSGVTTLMRSPIGPILADENAKEICRRLVEEIGSIAKSIEAPIKEDIVGHTFRTLDSLAPSMKSSMQRDMEKNLHVEADHFHGELLNIAKRQGKDQQQFPILTTVYSNLKVYESQL